MPILGINNRTENWKTASLFAPLLGERRVRLAHLLGEDWQTEPHEVRIELFWKGMRDYLHMLGKSEAEYRSEYQCKFRDAYEKLFGDLRDKMNKYAAQPGHTLSQPDDLNYDPTMPAGEKGLFDNLRNTEIDIVLETPTRLYMGEAKQEESWGADGRHVLVHQLIRQYVMGRILIHLIYCEKTNNQSKKIVVPFVVVDKDKHDSVMNTGQVNFMMQHYGLDRSNVLTWDDIRGLHP